MATFKAKFNDESTFKASFKSGANMRAGFGNVQVVETGDYNALANKPSIEDVVLQGNKTFKQLGLEPMSVQEVQSILYLSRRNNNG